MGDRRGRRRNGKNKRAASRGLTYAPGSEDGHPPSTNPPVDRAPTLKARGPISSCAGYRIEPHWLRRGFGSLTFAADGLGSRPLCRDLTCRKVEDLDAARGSCGNEAKRGHTDSPGRSLSVTGAGPRSIRHRRARAHLTSSSKTAPEVCCNVGTRRKRAEGAIALLLRGRASTGATTGG